MVMGLKWRRLGSVAGALAAGLLFAVSALAQTAKEPSGEPITIGFSMALTGPLAVNGKSGLLATQIWAEDVNAKGGLLGRPVKLVYYDDQSNPSQVPGIYTKLLDVDKVDFVVSGYATNISAPAMPIVIGHDKTFISLFALDINEEFNYPKYFSMLPTGPEPRRALTQGFFEIIKAHKDRLGLKTIAIATGDGEATRNGTDGARENAKEAGLRIVYDRTYPLNTADFTPVVRALQATNADVILISSYPADSVGIIRSANELGLKAKVFGGNMTGPQSTSIKTSLGPMLNGIITFDWWLPAPKMMFPGVAAFLERYQARAGGEGVDPLGYYLGPWAYARMQVLGDAIEGTKSLDQQKVADYIRDNTFNTVVGDVKFGKKGEWDRARILAVQFQNIAGTSLDDFRDGKGEVVVWPEAYKAGDVILPYTEAKGK
ncbi:MAG: amino acid ABC transporter substrate-binding protein [Alphaproteobacteria bacterium]